MGDAFKDAGPGERSVYDRTGLPEVAAIARMGAGVGLVERLQDAFNACRPMNGSNELDNAAAAISDAIAHIAALTAERRTLRLVIDANIEKHRSRAEAAEAERDYTHGTNEVLRAENQRIEAERDALRERVARLEGALRKLHHAVCGETGFAACVRLDSGKAYPWPALDDADEATRAALTDGGKDG